MADGPLIAVTGATGAVGSRVVRRLEAPRLVVRDRARAPEGADAREASDYGAAGEMRAALEGVQTLFLIPAAEAPDRVDRHRAAVDAAVAAGVERIVYLSWLTAAADDVFTLGRDHWHTEQHIRASGLEWTFLRMNLYMDFIPGMVGEDGVIRGPAGDGKVSAILRDDVAATAAAVLPAAADHAGRTYELTGPAAFSLAEAAALLGATYVDETDEEAFASRAHFGAPEFEVRGWVSSYWAIRAGGLARVSGDVEALTGRAPTTLAEHRKVARPDLARGPTSLLSGASFA